MKTKYLIWCETQDIDYENNIVYNQFLVSYTFSLRKAKNIVKEKNKYNNGYGTGHLRHFYYEKCR